MVIFIENGTMVKTMDLNFFLPLFVVGATLVVAQCVI